TRPPRQRVVRAVRRRDPPRSGPCVACQAPTRFGLENLNAGQMERCAADRCTRARCRETDFEILLCSNAVNRGTIDWMKKANHSSKTAHWDQDAGPFSTTEGCLTPSYG